MPCQWTWEKWTLQNSRLAANIPYTTNATKEGAGAFSHKDWTIIKESPSKTKSKILTSFANNKPNSNTLVSTSIAPNGAWIFYTLHPKFFECTFCTIKYDTCYTLHPDIKFAVYLDRKVWHHMKWPNCSSSQSIKNKEEITFYHLKLYS